jgi:hypothetical protein
MAFWKHDHEQHAIHSIQAIAVGQTTTSERVNLNLTIEGKRHMLQFGPWSPGEFASAMRHVHGKGTTPARVTRLSETEWMIEAPEGSAGRLWNIDDPKSTVDQGLHQFSFNIRFQLEPNRNSSR